MAECFIQKLLPNESNELRKLQERDRFNNEFLGSSTSNNYLQGKIDPTAELGHLIRYEEWKGKSSEIIKLNFHYSFDWPCMLIKNASIECGINIASIGLSDTLQIIFPWDIANKVEEAFSFADLQIYKWRTGLTFMQSWFTEGSTPMKDNSVYHNAYNRVKELLMS